MAIEILAYSPNDMDDFLAFVRDGRPDGSGGFQRDSQGREMIGVLRWLHSLQVPEAHFFNNKKSDPAQLFIATVQSIQSPGIPWLPNKIPGFDELIRRDGLIGRTNTFPSMSTLLDTVMPNQDLDDKFAQGKADLDTVFAELNTNPGNFSVTKDQILAALGSISLPIPVFDEIRSKLGISL